MAKAQGRRGMKIQGCEGTIQGLEDARHKPCQGLNGESGAII